MKELEYRAVQKKESDSELTHWKYVKREKVNGKYRYYYSKPNLSSAVKTVSKEAGNVANYVKQEGSRDAQNIAYDTANEALKYRQSMTDDVGEYLARTIQRGYVGVLKILNNIGDGTLDDSLNQFMQNANKKINGLFQKLRDKLK